LFKKPLLILIHVQALSAHQAIDAYDTGAGAQKEVADTGQLSQEKNAEAENAMRNLELKEAQNFRHNDNKRHMEEMALRKKNSKTTNNFRTKLYNIYA
jgi:hypothetical protein